MKLGDLKSLLLVILYAIFSAIPVAQAQDSMSSMGPEELSDIVTVIPIIEVLIFASILLIARRNMAGWGIPLKQVLFTFNGRLNRKVYWLKGVVFISLVQAVFPFLLMIIAWPVFFLLPDALPVFMASTFLIMMPFIVFYIWASFAISIKRLHDLDRSGWFLLLGLIPLVNIWLIITIAFFRGTSGVNRFGSDPLDGQDGEYAPTERYDAPAAAPSETFGGGIGHRKKSGQRLKQAFPNKRVADPEHDDHRGENEHDLISRRLGVEFDDDDTDEPK